MIVSGYHYHKRAAEAWCDITDPTEEDWAIVNGRVPDGMQPGESYSQMLQRLDQESGLLAEMQFREKHFRGMDAWPIDDPDILTFRLRRGDAGNEEDTYRRLLEFYGVSKRRLERGVRAAVANSAAKMSGTNTHIRNPKPNKWKDTFTDVTESRFEELFPGLVERAGYA